MRLKIFLFAVIALSLLASAGCPHARANATTPAAAQLKDLQNLDELKALFNHDHGSPRLVLLLSPTWPVCTAGTRWVQKELLEKHPSANLRVYAIWFNMFPGDARSKWDARLLTDSRVVHFWDEQKVVGTWYGKHPDYLNSDSVLWDAFILYGADSRWTDSPTQRLAMGWTIISKREELLRALLPLLTK